jgi:hypothetical protein
MADACPASKAFVAEVERQSARPVSWTVLTQALETPIPSRVDVVVAVVSRDLEVLTRVAAVKRCLTDPYYMFVFGDADDAARASLEALDITPALGISEAAIWLSSALSYLSVGARARMLARHMAECVPPLPERQAARDVQEGLFEAEQRFRESFVRCVLARAGSRVAAAEMAKVSYRTFCQILTKLNISCPLSATATER